MKLALMRLVVVSLFAISVFCLRCPAQTGLATVTGEVTDAQGKLVPGVSVAFTNINTGIANPTTTNSQGIYSLPALQPGIYRANVSKEGFKGVVKPEIELHTQDQVSLNFSLELGSISETVTVSADAEHVESDNPSVSLVVTRDFVDNMPLNGRSFQDLLALAPGAVSSAQTNGTYSIDGQRDDANNFSVDGVGANLGASSSGGALPTQLSGSYPTLTAIGTTQSLLPVDAMQEFRIQTSGYTAEYGRQPGGQVGINSRSGENDYHGSAFDYFRNTVLDANEYFANAHGDPRSAEHQNDFGGTLGGPLSVPRLYDGKDKTFFFFSYEGLRLLLPNFVSDYSVPTDALRQSAAPGVQPFLNANPLPNGPANPDGITALFSGGYSSPNNLNSWGMRIDQVIGTKFRLFFRIGNTTSSVEYPYQPLGSTLSTVAAILTETAGATISITPALVDEFRFNYSRSEGRATTIPTSFFKTATPLPLNLLIPSQYFTPGGYSVGGNISVPDSSLYQDYEYYSYPFTQHQYNLVDSISWTHGRHAVKGGLDYRRLSPIAGYGAYGNFFGIGSLADLENGNVDSVFAYTTLSDAAPIYNNLALYIQDHWKMATNFTLDYGLRWEIDPPPNPTNGQYYPALTSSNLSVTQIAPNGTNVYRTVYDNFAPRLGFSWQPVASAAHSLVIRGGSGIFYDTGQNLAGYGYESWPYYGISSYSNVSLPFSQADLIAPPPVTTPLSPPYSFLFGLSDPNLKLPYTVSWNLSVDTGLSAKNTLTTSYVGNIGRRLLFQQGVENNPLFGSGNFATTNAASSSYNALQVQDRGYIAPGLQIIASYAWAHAIDDASTDGVIFDQGTSPVRGNSDNDIRQVLNAALNYEAPGTGSSRLTRALTHGWVVSNRFTAESGYPLNIVQTQYTSPVDGYAYDLSPDLVPGVPIYLHGVPNVPGGWELNKDAFADVPLNPDGAPTRNGTLGRNFVRGPGFWTLNTAVQRNVNFGDQLRLMVRVEAFNIFNHSNFGSIDTYLPDALFGQATGMTLLGANSGAVNGQRSLYGSGAPRSLQLSLKLQF